MQIPFNTPLGFIGFLLLGLGVFLLLTGFNILKIEKITVKPGTSTWGIGAAFAILGVLLVFLGDPERGAGNGSNPNSIPTAPVETPVALSTIVSSPVDSRFEEQYNLLADASRWPITEAESFDTPDAGWLGFGTHEDPWVKHNQRIEDGKLRWGLELISPNLWYWQASPYFSYRDFYLSTKFRRDPGSGNFTYYGLFFRKQGDKFYLFRIDENQRFAVHLFDNGDWTDLIGWTKSAEIAPGKFNELTVIADGSIMSFFINKIFVGDVDNDALDNGEVGFAVAVNDAGPEAVFEFDDFELREKP